MDAKNRNKMIGLYNTCPMITSETFSGCNVDRFKASRMVIVPSSLALKDESFPQNEPEKLREQNNKLSVKRRNGP